MHRHLTRRSQLPLATFWAKRVRAACSKSRSNRFTWTTTFGLLILQWYQLTAMIMISMKMMRHFSLKLNKKWELLIVQQLTQLMLTTQLRLTRHINPALLWIQTRKMWLVLMTLCINITAGTKTHPRAIWIIQMITNKLIQLII